MAAAPADVLDEFEAGRSLTRYDVRMIVSVDDRVASRLVQPSDDVKPVVEGGAGEDHLRAACLGCRDLDRGRVDREHDDGAETVLPCGESDGERMVAGALRDHA